MLARYGYSSVVLPDAEESIVLMGGVADNWTHSNQVWRSSDVGVTWTQLAGISDWQPNFTVDPATNTIAVHGWPPHTELTITIGDPNNPSWSKIIEADENGDFWADSEGEYDIDTGDLVTVTDGVIVKEHIVTALRISEVDTQNNIITGVAQPGSEVEVVIYYSWPDPTRIVTVDINGNWEVDFSEAEGPEQEQRAYDIGPGDAGNANQRDEDGDETHIYWSIHSKKSIFGLYDPHDSYFHLEGISPIRFGQKDSDWQPFSGDWNGDGTYSVGLYDQVEGNFWLYNGPGDIDHVRWGGSNSGRIALAGDWNGDGIYGVGLYDHTEGKFYLRLSSDEHIEDRFGSRGNDWIPVAGNFNGDGMHTVALYDAVDGFFHPYQSDAIRFGPKGADWTPVTGDWNGDGAYGFGLHHDGHFHLDASAGLDAPYRYGPRGDTDWIPATGRW